MPKNRPFQLSRRSNIPTAGTLQGVITIVQEDRFRMEDQDGRGYLLTLGHRAGASIPDLEAWRDGSVPIQVRFEGPPDLGAIALEIRASA